jgi:hypothetical protein
MMPFLRASAFLALFAVLPGIASAQGWLEGDLSKLAGGLMPSFGSGGTGATLLNSTLAFLATRIMMLAGIVATFIIVKAGLSLVNSQDESKIEKARRQIGIAISAVVLGFLSQRFVEAIYGSANDPGSALFNPARSVSILDIEARGLISWATELMVIVAIVILVGTGVRVVASFGKEDAAETLKRSVFSVVVGLLILSFSGALQLALGFNPQGAEVGGGNINADFLFARLVGLTQSVLSYMALIAVAVVIYAGFRMIFAMGDEGKFAEARKLIIRVLMGLFVILMSYVFTVFILALLNP